MILLHDTTPDEPKTLLELKVKKAATQPAPSRDGAGPSGTSAAPGLDLLTGAAAAAGVLTAVDEDDDGEEAEIPEDFNYHSEEDEGDE